MLAADQHPCSSNNNCKKKAKELLNRVKDVWNLNKETPQRHDLWHTPQRIERNTKADLMNVAKGCAR